MSYRSVAVTGLILLVSGALSAQPVRTREPVLSPERLPARYTELALRYESLTADRERWYSGSLDTLYERYREAVSQAVAEEQFRDGERATAYREAVEADLALVRRQRASVEEQERLIRAEILATLQTEPPGPGTPSARALFEWAAARVHIGPRRRAMVYELLALGSARSSGDEREQFLSSLSGRLFADGVLGDDGSVLLAEAVELLALQLIVVPSAGLTDFVSVVADSVSTLGTGGRDAGAELERLANLDRIERGIIAREFSGPALAALSPAIFAPGDDAVPVLRELEQGLGRELRLIGATSPGLLTAAARENPAFEFLSERVDSLLLAATRGERRRFAGRVGFSPRELHTLTQDLYAVRSAPEPPPLLSHLLWSAEPQPTPPLYPPIVREPEQAAFEPVESRAYTLYLELGEEGAAAVAQLEASSSPRTGDDYRWTMLGALSHPYALELLSTRPDYQPAGRLLDQFVAGVYEQAQEFAGFPIVYSDRTSLTGFSRYDRTATVTRAEQVPIVYQSFVRAAQELDSLPESYLEEYAPGVSQAEHWAHLHGLAVVLSEDSGGPAGVAGSADWFRIAGLAAVPDEQFAHQVRGLGSLADEVDRLADETASLAPVRLESVAPELVSARAWANSAVQFLRPSPTVRRVLEFRLGFGSYASPADALFRRHALVADALRRLGPVVAVDKSAFVLLRTGEEL